MSDHEELNDTEINDAAEEATLNAKAAELVSNLSKQLDGNEPDVCIRALAMLCSSFIAVGVPDRVSLLNIVHAFNEDVWHHAGPMFDIAVENRQHIHPGFADGRLGPDFAEKLRQSIAETLGIDPNSITVGAEPLPAA